jgi:hypothetical protein
MKKEYIIGGLAIVGGLSLLAYLTSKPRRNSEGFFNAGGKDKGNVIGKPQLFESFNKKDPQFMGGGCFQFYRATGSPYISKTYINENGILTGFTNLISEAEFATARRLPKCTGKYEDPANFYRKENGLCCRYTKSTNGFDLTGNGTFYLKSRGGNTSPEFITTEENRYAYYSLPFCNQSMYNSNFNSPRN